MTRKEQRPRLVRNPEVRELLGGISASTLFLWVSKGHFPKPIKIGAKAVAWDLDQIERWIEERAKATGHPIEST